MNAESFFSRWQARSAEPDGHAVAPDAKVPETRIADPNPAPAPLPTESDLADLAPGASVADFMRAGVDQGVRRGALKKLFADPHYNVMDGLDIYISDYGLPDPIPEAMLRGLNQVKNLFLFEHAADRPGVEPAVPQVADVEDVRVAESGMAGVDDALADGGERTGCPDVAAVAEPQDISLDAEMLDAEISPPSRPSPIKGEGVDGVACSVLKEEG